MTALVLLLLATTPVLEAEIDSQTREDDELPPSSVWFAGGEAIATAVAGLGYPGEWRMVATAANGQPAAAAYRRSVNGAYRRGVNGAYRRGADGTHRRGADGAYRAYGIVVLTVSTTGIARIVVFGDPGLFGRFGLPPTWR